MDPVQCYPEYKLSMRNSLGLLLPRTSAQVTPKYSQASPISGWVSYTAEECRPSPRPALLQGYILKVLGTGRQVHWGCRNTFWCQESTTSTISFLMVAYLHIAGVCHTRIIHHCNQLATVNHTPPIQGEPLFKKFCGLPT